MPIIAVLYGGDSDEREVSIRSGKAVFEALKLSKFEVLEFDINSATEIPPLDIKKHIVFPILHGRGGEDGELQQHLEDAGLSYLGSDPLVSKNCFDKHVTREHLHKNSILIPRGDALSRENFNSHVLRNKSHVIKISNGGSSIGTWVVKDPDYKISEHEVFGFDDRVIIEEYVEGVEITVPVLGNRALPVIEIQPPADGLFDYENKYNGQTKEICPSTSLSPSKQVEAQELALKVHKLMGCRHLSRTDMIVRNDGSIVVLEINTMPGMTSSSLYPLSARTAGIEMQDLVTEFVKMVSK